VDNAWNDTDAEVDEKVFGSCLRKDNIYQCIPQPNLHGMDEGVCCKCNSGVLEELITEAKTSHNLDATKVQCVGAGGDANDHCNVHF